MLMEMHGTSSRCAYRAWDPQSGCPPCLIASWIWEAKSRNLSDSSGLFDDFLGIGAMLKKLIGGNDDL